VQVTFEFLDPAPGRLTALRGISPLRGLILLRFRGTVIAGFTEPAERVLLPAVQIGRIQAVLAAPGAAGGFVHRGGGNHRLQPCRRGPVPRAAIVIIGSQGGSTPALQGRDTDADLLRDGLHWRTFGWQQAGHHRVFELLSVASHACLPAPPE
jgi:hypothetical protein